MTSTVSWVVGRGGLLGRNVEASLNREDGSAEIWRPEAPIGWHELELAGADLDREATKFLRHVARSRRPWRLLWCAGSGVVATSSETLAQETELVRRFLNSVTERLSDDVSLARAGIVFFASTAGGVYAASAAEPPFDERSPVCALAPYGHEKLAQEDLFARFAETSGVDLLIGRFSNLYGAGQKISKPQGLISHVGLAALRREPILIYVPLDTIRDYLFAADAGSMVVEAIERREASRREGDPAETVTKIFASEVETTVAAVLGAWRQALHHPLRIAFGSSPVGQLQPRVLSFRSRAWPDVRGRPTLLSVGIDAVRRDQLARLLATGV